MWACGDKLEGGLHTVHAFHTEWLIPLQDRQEEKYGRETCRGCECSNTPAELEGGVKLGVVLARLEGGV